MKKVICLALLLLMGLNLWACDGSGSKSQESKPRTIDYDLTAMNDTMLQSMALDINNNYTNYLGKTISVPGLFYIYQDETTGNCYYEVYIYDSTACCPITFFEFVTAEDVQFPEQGSSIVVTGVFKTYYEGNNMYCHLADAELVVK